jgi:lipoyl(octanoyl) transferase
MIVNIVYLGRMIYGNALELQEKLLVMRQQNKIQDTLLIVEHPPVLTLGRRGKETNILAPKCILDAEGIEIFEVNRGGDITYHGPGQIVGYPILDLHNYGTDIHLFVHNIEEVFIQLLKCKYNIAATRIKEYTGVWVGNEKITAIGFAVKRWVTMHGFAFNVNTNLKHFELINPCGITDKGITSLQKILGDTQDLELLNRQVTEYFCKVFNAEPNVISINKLFEIYD